MAFLLLLKTPFIRLLVAFLAPVDLLVGQKTVTSFVGFCEG